MMSNAQTEAIDWPVRFLELDAAVRIQPYLRQKISDAEIRLAAAQLELREAREGLEAARGKISGTMAFWLSDNVIRVVRGVAVAKDASGQWESSARFIPNGDDLVGREAVVESSGDLSQQSQLGRNGFGLRVRVIGTQDCYIVVPTECEIEILGHYRE